ncbi:MAG TPA: prepilin-type N-terminal cleavage/methylation domain-containing protein [Verrucomicrobiae bacterium]|jgi:prepilin-type N-terminal cleavage/methylation domain-containing protein
MKMRHQRRSLAFTLIEVMIAVAIFSMVIAAIFSIWNLINQSLHTAQQAAAQVQRERIAIHSIEDSLISIQSFQASPQYYSFVVQNGDSPMLQFTSELPSDFIGGGRYPNFNVRRLIFTVEPPPNPVNAFTVNANEKDLVLRQYPILTGMSSDEQINPLVLARNVQKFSVECWDTNTEEWSDEWETTNSIPPMVRIDLEVGRNTDNFANSAPAYSVSRIIAIPTQMMPTAVQVPNGNGTTAAPPR